MSQSKRSREFVRFFKKQSRAQDELRSFFEIETERIAVPRFRICLSLLLLFVVVSSLVELWGQGWDMKTPLIRSHIASGSVLSVFGVFSFIPQFRRSTYAFTVMLAVFVGVYTITLHLHAPVSVQEHVALGNSLANPIVDFRFKPPDAVGSQFDAARKLAVAFETPYVHGAVADTIGHLLRS